MHFCNQQANKRLSSDTRKWKQNLLPEISSEQQTKHINKGPWFQDIPKTSVEQRLCAVCACLCRSKCQVWSKVREVAAGARVLSVCCWLERWEHSRAGCFAIKEEITPGMLHSSPSETKRLFWENMQPCTDGSLIAKEESPRGLTSNYKLFAWMWQHARWNLWPCWGFFVFSVNQLTLTK